MSTLFNTVSCVEGDTHTKKKTIMMISELTELPQSVSQSDKKLVAKLNFNLQQVSRYHVKFQFTTLTIKTFSFLSFWFVLYICKYVAISKNTQ